MQINFEEVTGFWEEWQRLSRLTNAEIAKELEQRVLAEAWKDPPTSMLIFMVVERLSAECKPILPGTTAGVLPPRR